MTDPRTKCTICRSPKSRDVAEAVLAGESNGAIAERFKFSRSAVQRHVQFHTLKDSLKKVRVQPRRRRKKASAGDVDVSSLVDSMIAELNDLRQDEQSAGRASAAALLSDKLIRLIELREKNAGRYGKPETQTTSARIEYANLLAKWSTENLDALISGYGCDNCGARTWVNIGDQPPALWLQAEPPKAPAGIEDERFMMMINARQTMHHGKPHWIIPVEKLPD